VKQVFDSFRSFGRAPGFENATVERAGIRILPKIAFTPIALARTP